MFSISTRLKFQPYSQTLFYRNRANNMKSCLILFLVASVVYVGPALAAISIDNWSYAGAGDTDQEFWKDIPDAYCDRSSQSPINIVTGMTQEIEHAEFDLDAYETNMNASLENNGHALEVEITENDHGDHYNITGGGLSGTFRAYQFHFHFGSNSTQGSEHTIDGKRYPAEMHIVHYDTFYASPNEAIQAKGGIAVLGFFLEEVDDDNSALDIILDEVSHVTQPHTHRELEDLMLSEILPSSLKKFWRYEGSLTTPLCNEVVTWTLFEDTIKISAAQLTTLRTLMSEAVNEDDDELPMMDNYRQIQSSGNRTIYSVIADDDVQPSPTASAGRSTPGAMVILAAFLTTISFRF